MAVKPPTAPLPKPPTLTDEQERRRKGLRLLRTGEAVAAELHQGGVDRALAKALIGGIKMAGPDLGLFKDPSSSPIKLYHAIQELGIQVLAWKPETLMAAIDKKFHGWSQERASEAVLKFHETGTLVTDVPSLTRQKLYAIRVVVTSDLPHNEWNVFEKVGSAFNNRHAKFDIVERLTTAECARTIAIIEAMRPDKYSNEIKVYIAATAHEDGFYTLEPSKYLNMAEAHLRQMNFESTGATQNATLVVAIGAKKKAFASGQPAIADDDLPTTQATKLLAVDSYGDEASGEGNI